MKRIIAWFFLIIFLMIACPWLTVKFAGTAGMAVCFLLFFAVNPLFSAISGIFAGLNIKKMWIIPIATAGIYLLGTWLFFESGESAFILYGCIYLIIGCISMLISAFIKKKNQKT